MEMTEKTKQKKRSLTVNYHIRDGQEGIAALYAFSTY
jgi:hypothetical protein